jgi:hypothetical protein
MKIRTSQLSDGEKSDIIRTLGEGKTVKEVARMFARDESTITRLIQEFRPTKDLAQAKLQAGLATLVDRVIEKADVDQAIKILSNAKVGVLEPEVKGGGRSGGINIAFGLSVGHESLAAVTSVTEFGDSTEPKKLEGEVGSRPVRLGSVLAGQMSVED